jgi:hypothetical protein
VVIAVDSCTASVNGVPGAKPVVLKLTGLCAVPSHVSVAVIVAGRLTALSVISVAWTIGC